MMERFICLRYVKPSIKSLIEIVLLILQLKHTLFLNTVNSSEFIVTKFILGDILGTTLLLSRLLQSIKLDAVSAIDAHKDVLSVLQTKRENIDNVF